MLAREKIDFAFVPLDPRQEEQYDWGIKYLLETISVPHVIPMHFWKQPEVIERLLSEPYMRFHAKRICPITQRGQSVTF